MKKKPSRLPIIILFTIIAVIAGSIALGLMDVVVPQKTLEQSVTLPLSGS